MNGPIEIASAAETAVTPDIQAGRRGAPDIASAFADAHPPLSPDAAVIEANRCYFCFAAPCTTACPTGIDVPGFIRRIATGNLKGAAVKILEENIFGGACARVCPTEILCERACVRAAEEERPVAIGALQRRATDWLMARGIQPFVSATPSGRRIAVVGAGPAGLACAHRLARLGHQVSVFEAREKPGGLNEYGIAAYKVPDDFAQAEIRFILGIGNITIETGRVLGRDFSLAQLRREFDAVFLGLGQAGVNGLGLNEPALSGLIEAVTFIARLRQSADKSSIPVGRRVLVIGGGNTAIDAATQSRLLGAEEVTIVYRRGPAQMSATSVEQDWAQTHGVRIRHFAAPRRLVAANGAVCGVEFARTRLDAAGGLVFTDETYILPADMVLKAVGQHFILPEAEGFPALRDGRIVVDAARQTSIPGVFAGGDATSGVDLTVRAVEDGKRAAEAIDRYLGKMRERAHG